MRELIASPLVWLLSASSNLVLRLFGAHHPPEATVTDEEIKILREMGVEVKSAYEKAISEMKRQVQQTAVEAHTKLTQSDSRVDEVLVSQLATDNEYLRKELSGMHHKQRTAVPPRAAQASAPDDPP